MITMVNKKTWEEFRTTGLVLFINQILHAFGWSIVFELDDNTGEIKNVYPARVKFRGFDAQSQGESYTKITEYLHKESDNLLNDVYETN